MVQVEVRSMVGACGAPPWAFLPPDDRSRSLYWTDPGQVCQKDDVRKKPAIPGDSALNLGRVMGNE